MSDYRDILIGEMRHRIGLLDEKNVGLEADLAAAKERGAALAAENAKLLDPAWCICGWCSKEVSSEEYLSHDCPENPRVKEIQGLQAALAASRKRVEEVAAALKRARELMGWSDTEVQDNKAQYEKLKDSLYDPAAIVEEIRREAAIEALRGLPGAKDMSTSHTHDDAAFIAGYNAYRDMVAAAIAALEAQNG